MWNGIEAAFRICSYPLTLRLLTLREVCVADCHRIDYALLRALVPHYRPHPHNTRGAEQEKVLFLLALYLDPVLDRWGSIAT